MNKPEVKIERLFSFQISKEAEIDESETTVNDKGEAVTVTKKIKKGVPQKFFLKRPNHKLQREGDLYYGVTLAEGVRAGLLTRTLLSKRYLDDGGAFSKGQKEYYAKLDEETIAIQTEFQRISLTNETDRTAEQKERLSTLIKRMSEIRVEIQNFEQSYQGLFEFTAENMARNQTVLWWVMQLSYIEEDKGKLNPYFGDGDLEKKLQVYEDLVVKKDSFINSVLQKFIFYVTLWYAAAASTQEEFELFEKKQSESSSSSSSSFIENSSSSSSV